MISEREFLKSIFHLHDIKDFNYLPRNIKDIAEISILKKHLKMHLFMILILDLHSNYCTEFEIDFITFYLIIFYKGNF